MIILRFGIYFFIEISQTSTMNREKKLGLKRWSKKSLGQTNISRGKKSWVKKDFGSKKVWVQKILGPEIFCV